MQGRDREYDYAVRSEIQIARLLNNNAKKGDQWKAKKVYQISVLNFHLPKDDRCEMSWYTMKNQKGHDLANHLNVIYIDLLEMKLLVDTPVEKLTPLQKWGLYFSYADDESKSDYINQLAESEKGIMEANRIIGRMSEEDSNWFRQNSIDTYWRDRNTELANAIKKGRAAGIAMGRAEGRAAGLAEGRSEGSMDKAIDVASKAIALKIPVDQISQMTGLPLEKIQELQEKSASEK